PTGSPTPSGVTENATGTSTSGEGRQDIHRGRPGQLGRGFMAGQPVDQQATRTEDPGQPGAVPLLQQGYQLLDRAGVDGLGGGPGGRPGPGEVTHCRHAQPPIADIGRAGWRNVGSSMPWPAGLPHIAVCQAWASSSSEAPARSIPRKSVSSWLNRHERTCPSAVSRVRSQAPQKGWVTLAITPTRGGPG